MNSEIDNLREEYLDGLKEKVEAILFRFMNQIDMKRSISSQRTYYLQAVDKLMDLIGGIVERDYKDLRAIGEVRASDTGQEHASINITTEDGGVDSHREESSGDEPDNGERGDVSGFTYG